MSTRKVKLWKSFLTGNKVAALTKEEKVIREIAEEFAEMREKVDNARGSSNAVDLTIDVANLSYACDMALPDLFVKIENEGWSVVNIRLTDDGCPMTYNHVGGNLPLWISAYYFVPMTTASPSDTVAYLEVRRVWLDDDGVIEVKTESKFTGTDVS